MGCCGSGSVEQSPEPNVEQIPPPSPALQQSDLAFLSEPEYEGTLFWLYMEVGERKATWKHCDFMIRSTGRIGLKTAVGEPIGAPIGAYDINETAWLAAIYGNALQKPFPPNKSEHLKNTGTRVLKVTSSGEPKIDLIFRFPTVADAYKFLKYCKHHIGKNQEFSDAKSNREFADLRRAHYEAIINGRAVMSEPSSVREQSSTSQDVNGPSTSQGTQPITSQPLPSRH